MISEFGPGRLTAAWLNSNEPHDSPWSLSGTDSKAEGHRDAFLGNGLIGQRIGVTGDATDCVAGRFRCNAGGCLIHGLWSEGTLMAVPKWALLLYNDGDGTFASGTGEWLEFRQELDLKRAILTTSVLWRNGGRRTRVRSRFYLSRTRPNIAVIEREIVPEFDGRVTFVDRIDGDFIGDAVDWRLQAADDPRSELAIGLTMGPRKRRVAIHSLLSVEAASGIAHIARQAGRSVERQVSFDVRARNTYRVRKFVAIATDADAPNPWTFARAQVHGALLDPDRLEREHTDAWAALWEHRIEVPHARLQTILNASLYQFYSCLRSGGRRSLGPTGLSGDAWDGHVFWDSDLWMFPGLCLLNPDLARGFVEYRKDTLEGARRNARAEGHEGALFAWQSAEFGDEMIPHLIYHHQRHVNSDVALAQWWFYLVSGDKDYLRDTAAEIILESARFWISRVEFNATKARYEIRHVCGADEDAGIQDNNAYTNFSAVKTIRLAQRVGEILGLEIPASWEDVAARMWIPFDEKERRFIQHEGYSGAPIKQADTALLIYPYEMSMPDEVKGRTVDYYRAKYPEGNIMMAAAFDGIVDCELGRADGGWESLLRLMPHFREPFLAVSESPANNCISFLTGLGGLLQLVLMGFAGIRMHENELVIKPCLPADLDFMLVRGLHFGGTTFDLRVGRDGYGIENSSGELPFRTS